MTRHGDEQPTQITAVIVTHNSAGVIADLLRSLPAGLRGIHATEFVVVDNASQDDTLRVVRDLMPEARVIRLERNMGYAAAINRAIRDATPSDAVLVLNPDVRLQPGAVLHLLSALRDERVGVAVPRLVDPAGATSWSLRRTPTIGRALGEAALGGLRAGRVSLLGELVTSPRRYERAGSVDWATGAAWLVSRRCVEIVGDWDESFFLYGEETDFALRARDAGFQVWYVPDAVFEHLGGDAHRSADLWALLTVNRVRLFRMRHRSLPSACYLAAVALGVGLRAALGRRTDRRAFTALIRWIRNREIPLAARGVEMGGLLHGS